MWIEFKKEANYDSRFTWIDVVNNQINYRDWANNAHYSYNIVCCVTHYEGDGFNYNEAIRGKSRFQINSFFSFKGRAVVKLTMALLFSLFSRKKHTSL